MLNKVRAEEDRGHFIRYLEIEKSRYVPQVSGKHPFRILSRGFDDRAESQAEERSGIVVYPALHWRVSTSESESRPKADEPSAEELTTDSAGQEHLPFDLGIKGFERILPKNLTRGSVVTIAGDRGTFKTTFAINFLAKGLLAKESALLVALSDRCLLTEDPAGRIKQRICEEMRSGKGNGRDVTGVRFEWSRITIDEKACEEWSTLAGDSRAQIRVWQNTYGKDGTRLIELDFKSGTVLPEEFVQVVWEVLERQREGGFPIKRVAFDDVSLIGLSYPLLRESATTGNLFLSGFVHVMQNRGVDLVIVGTTGDLPEANEPVYRAAALSDAVVS